MSKTKSSTHSALIAALCVGLIIIGAITFFIMTNRQQKSLYQTVQDHFQTAGESAIALGELVNGDWNQAVYFSHTSPEEIYQVAGLNFNQTDLTTGLLFAKDNKIIYSEIFPQKSAGLGPDLYPVKLALESSSSGVTVFAPNDLFVIEQKTNHFNQPFYSLTPL